MDEPRYVWRELHGGRISDDPRDRAVQTATFTILDSFYCYEVIFQIESGGGNQARALLRRRVVEYCDRLNTPVVCKCDGCDAELDVTYERPIGVRKYCCSLHMWRQTMRDRVRKAAAA